MQLRIIIFFVFSQILTPSTPDTQPQPLVEMENHQTMTITLSVTVPSFLSIIVFLIAFIVRRRQVARRNIERVPCERGNVIQMETISGGVEEVRTLLSPRFSPRVTRSAANALQRDTLL